MDTFKEYICRLRKLSLKEPYITIEDIIPNLKQYVYLLCNEIFEEGIYHAFYGKIKKIISSFLYYYTTTIDNINKNIDKYSHKIDKNELLRLIEQTVDMHQRQQISFGRDFLPLQSLLEKENYEKIEERYKFFREELLALKDKVDGLDSKENVDHFATEHFQLYIKNISEIFEFTHIYISMMLVDRLQDIQVSLEEILLRFRSNLRTVKDACDVNLNNLRHQIYDKNKEQLQISRQYRKCSTETAEINRAIEIIREKIEHNKYEGAIRRLNEEIHYWETKLKQYYEVADYIKKLKAEQAELTEQERIHNSMQNTELPGSKYEDTQSGCLGSKLGENFKERKEYLKHRIIEAAKTLMTFFSVKGTDRILYTDNLGRYYLDEYNHKVYFCDHGLSMHHLDCEGGFRKASDKEKYLFDENGRYVEDKDGTKLYQCAPCTSTYELRNDGLFTKVTKDCGHSEAFKRNCKMRINDPTDVEILPAHYNNFNIKGTLDPETAKYLWDSLGHISPDALHDVGSNPIKNPIHCLAHKLLSQKYNRTQSELREKMKEAQVYRANIYEERKNKAEAASEAWKMKQVKRRKPEETDDTQDRAVFDTQAAEREFINSTNYFYD